MQLKVRDAWVPRLSMLCAIVVTGCTIQHGDTTRQLTAAKLIATPPAHYSTQKARYLGEKYQGKLDRLIEMIIANPKTSKLQFANNLGSSGGIGFFTHSAVKAPDERFLEVVLGTGENLDAGEYSGKVARLFSLYGKELLVILASDVELYNDRELSGYGLNFTWRTLGSRASTERAIVYFSKEKVRAFLREDIDENTLLAEAVIFVIEAEGQANLLSFRVPEPVPDVRAPIQEQVILPEPTKAKPDRKRVVSQQPGNHTEAITPPTNVGDNPAGERKGEIIASQTQTGSNPTTPNGSIGTKQKIVPDEKIGMVIGEKSDSVRTGSVTESIAEPGSNPIPDTGVVKISEAAQPAVEFAQPQLETKAIQPELQVEKRGAKISEANSSVKVAKEMRQLELTRDVADSQRQASSAEVRTNEASKGDLEIPMVPALASAGTKSSSPKQANPGSEIDKVVEVASIPKIHPKAAHTEKAAPGSTQPAEQQKAETVEQQSLLAHAKPIDDTPELKSLVRPMPKALEGYIIQVSFKDHSEARRWAGTFQQRGYSVSITEAGTAESLRVRIGNFRSRDDAERQHKSIRETGVVGIILNLPQAYQPEVRSSLP
jgi:cell division protein FtsN